MPALDRIHVLFLLYSGAHNVINAFGHAHNLVFFLFVVVGILSVELMLWGVYKHWKEGRLIGPMQRVSLVAGGFAMLYATAGILAQAQTGGEAPGWLSTYYAWVLPTSAPVMFLFAFLIQSVDPIANAERRASELEELTAIEEGVEATEQRRLELDYRRGLRTLKAGAQQQRLSALWGEALSRRVRKAFKLSARVEMPRILKLMGVRTPATSERRFFGLRAPDTYRLLEQATPAAGADRGQGDGQTDGIPEVDTLGKQRGRA